MRTLIDHDLMLLVWALVTTLLFYGVAAWTGAVMGLSIDHGNPDDEEIM